MEDLRYAHLIVDDLNPRSIWIARTGGGAKQGDADYSYSVQLNAWVRYRDELRDKIARIANEMARNGLAERAVRIQEQEQSLVVHFLETIVDQLDLSPAQRARLGPAVRDSLPILEGSST